ncbi:hypothetical protein [Acinetobacter sp. TSRC1-2]|uniref:hypothetical protein n=1 Tax=unclassified Acinetobacter TaxID=196816 RepID=UPI003CF1C0EC
MMNWTDLLQHYGYFAIFIGSFFEGETVLMLGAYAVHQHIFNFWLLIIVVMLGGFLGGSTLLLDWQTLWHRIY